jgi:hypothetical protein
MKSKRAIVNTFPANGAEKPAACMRQFRPACARGATTPAA